MKTLSEDTLRDARKKLLSRGVLLRDRMQRVQADLRRTRADAAAAHETDEVLLAIERSDSAELSRIESAFDHMEDDTFGLCEECGHEIEAARFVAIPDATHCMACAPDA
ncbi:MAG TPA: TraR/DksA C4-type zinc finger protein [Steroidobacteraceae bacterium]|jgi:RNA polymerase-binding transcription factor DksA|nr:TraR/DksA C4-type zinc finger protein [Steroidobacteraceae bacterium]